MLLNQTEVVLNAGSAFTLYCHGNRSVRWSTNAFRSLSGPPDLVEVAKSDPRHTGTYRCGYTNQSLEHLNSWIHIYVKDVSHPSSVFVTPGLSPSAKEGQDFLYKCLLTDPSVTNLTFQSEEEAGNRGRSLPRGMNVTLDPRRGALIRQPQRTFNGRYVCSGSRYGQLLKSKPVDLIVVPVLRSPPSVSVRQNEFVRLEGETFEVTCLTSNPSHFHTITWTCPHSQATNITVSRRYSNRLYMNSTLTVAAVTLTHSGQYTCSARNEAGVSMAAAQLRVLDRPYLRVNLHWHTNANADANGNTKTMEVKEILLANVSGWPMKEEGQPDANNNSSSMEESWDLFANVSTNASISSHSRVEVYEGQDVTLTFVMEAYPPIRSQHWTTPTHINHQNAEYKQNYSINGYRSEASLVLHWVHQEERGWYSFHLENLFFSGSLDVDLRVFRSPRTVITLDNGTLTCSSSGYPRPTILWLTCIGVEDTCRDSAASQVSPSDFSSREEEEVMIHLPLPLLPGDDVTVECVAYNNMGESRDAFVLRELHTFLTPALTGVLSVAAVLLLLLLVVSYKLKQKPKYEIRWKIIESSDGNNYTFLDPNQLPYNQKWEFPRDKLRLGAVLGSGAFGKVVEATAYGLRANDVTRVAVKMLKPSAHSEERDALMSELKILSHLGYHDNIVNLLGACTQGGPMLMITEYCSHGDLLNFLRAHAHNFMASMLSVDEVEDEAFYRNMASQHIRLRSDSGISCCSEYQEMQPILVPGKKHSGMQKDSLSFSDLMRFSYQVAQGLDFLSTRNCIHRDVAARNVLLTHHHVAKICDFGLARDIRNDDSYIVQGNARLPVKWMAPESIFQCVYTVQSDVWSYGVLLWEIFSLGKSPYPNIAVDTNFYKMIKDGCHMNQPDFAPAEMYQLMTLCWSLEPTDRPTFKSIGHLINRLLPSTKDGCSNHSDQVLYRNIDECKEEEEEEEEDVGGVLPKRELARDHCEDEDEEEDEDAAMKNIYQLS
ncbi:macrophage colony-stimulating factor 1 receptor 2 [Aulostomus maculatus]